MLLGMEHAEDVKLQDIHWTTVRHDLFIWCFLRSYGLGHPGRLRSFAIPDELFAANGGGWHPG
jgi:hypothetical protein